jgi:hypothetical protein
MSDSLPNPVRGNFVLLRADSLRLLLPLNQVGAAEYLDHRPVPGRTPGLLQVPGDETRRPYAVLSAQLYLLPQCPEDRYVVTTLGGDEQRIGWCWNEMRVLLDAEVKPLPIPQVLMAGGTPVATYAELDGELVFLCEAEPLTAFALTAVAR